MTLLQEIQSKAPGLIAGRDYQAIADAVNVGRTKVQSKMIGVGTILAKFGGQGGVFLDTLAIIGQTDRDIFWLLESNIKRGEFDIGDPASRAGMQTLSLQLPDFSAGINALLALAEVPDHVSANDVENVLTEVI